MNIPSKTILQLITFSFLLFSCPQTKAQTKLSTPTPEDIELAKALNQKYSEDEARLAILDANIRYEFELDKTGEKVRVVEYKNKRYINLNLPSYIPFAEYYDDDSEISKYQFKNRKDRKIQHYLRDDYYEIDGFFYHDRRLKGTNFEFKLPGELLVTEVEKNYFDIKYFTSVYFRERFPLEQKLVQFNIPNWLNIDLKTYNFDGFDIEESQSKEEESTIYTFKLKDAKAIPDEGNKIGSSYEEPHILILPKSFNHKGKIKTLFEETGDLYTWYKSLVDQMDEKPEELKGLVEKLIKDLGTDEEKIKRLFYWVQDNIKYIAFEDGIAGFKPDDSQEVYRKKYGDCKGMSNLLRQMLILAGFDARLSWIGTKRIAYDYSTPNLAVDNHVICALNHKGKRYFLDGTQNYIAFGEYAERIQGQHVLIEDGEDFILDYVPSFDEMANTETFNLEFDIEGEDLVGKAEKTFLGESRSQFMTIYNGLKTDKKEEVLKHYLKRGNNKLEVSNIESSDLEHRDQKMTINYDLRITNQVLDYDGVLYVDLDFFQEYAKLEFEDRKSAYNMGYKTNYISKIILNIPKGHKLNHKPEDIEVDSESFSVSLTYKLEQNQLICTKHFKFKTGVIPKSEFDTWDTFSKLLNANYNNQILIKKL